MNLELKYYYRKHFDQFQHLSVTEIEELNEYEQRLQLLPDMFYKERQRLAVYTNPHYRMQDVLQNILRIYIN
ncbi:hypothetical protein PDL71_08110 [Lacibacter sp. MH-610]|uniref:hypothetical protein n=1 Tax=Lacibacter sp. MH-610 TaxID=3020883 RepID=UPI0038926DF2